MAHHKDAIKRAKQSERRRAHNRHYRSNMRTQIKKVRAAVEAGNLEAATAELNKAVSVLHSLAAKKIIRDGNADRHVSRLYKAVNTLKAGN